MVATLVRLWLVAACLAIASASPSLEDETALLQTGTAVQRSGVSACQCLSWKEVYSKHGVECGAGQELAFAGGLSMKPLLGMEFCTHFYEKLSGSFCTNLHFNEQRTEQWCYVSSACQALNGGGAVGSLKWKQCTVGQDAMLGEMTPEQVHQVAVAEDKDAGLVLKMAYPLYKQGLHWPDVLKCLGGGAGGPKCDALRAVQAMKRPVIFDSVDGHPPFGVVNGSRAFEARFTAWFFKTDQADPSLLFKHPGKMNEVSCVAGCSP